MAVLGKYSHRLEVLKFLFSYVALMGVALFLIGYKPLQDVLDINGLYSRSVVSSTAFFLKLTGLSVQTNGTVLHTPQASLDVRFGCNGLEAVIIYAVALLTFPAPWIKKLTGIATGLVVIQLLNLLRIVALALVMVHIPGFFELFHIYVAQGIMIAIALVLFGLWIAYATKTS